jgi:hypothetical protein
MFLRVNNDYFPKHHQQTDACNDKVLCFFEVGTELCYLDELRLQSELSAFTCGFIPCATVTL